MATFQIKFHRYDKKSGQSRKSGVVHFTHNDGFHAAYLYAQTMMHGMAAADPERDYSIISILSHEFRGEDCEGGSRLWETAEEFSARVAEQA